MNRPATWKVVTLGAALTGLGIVGAGTAAAATAPAPAPASLEASLNWAPELGEIVALGDDWTETYWDENWNAGQRWADDWTETYWDD